MAGEQDIVMLGLDIDSFNEQKKTRLREFISLFNDLSKYDGKIFNPVMGDGLTKFNTSIAQTNQLIDQMNSKLSSFVSSGSSASSSMNKAAQSTTELGLATQQYGKSADQASVLSAKLAVSNSEQAKETAALKIQLSENNKQLAEEARLTNESIQAKNKQKIAAESYRVETQRVVASLRLLAIEQDREAKQNIVDATEKKRLAAAEYRAETQRVVATLRQLAIEQDKAAASANKSALPFGKFTTATSLAGNSLNQFSVNAGGSNVALEGLGTKLTHTLTLMRYIAYILPGLGIAGIFNLAFEAISSATQAIIGNTDSLENNIEQQNRLNKSIVEQIDNYETLKSLIREIEDITGSKYIGGKLGAQIKDQDEYLSLITAEGIEKGKVLEQDLKLLKARQELAKTEVFIGGNTGIESLKKEIENKTSDLQTISGYINRVNFAIDKRVDYIDPQTKRVLQNTDDKEKKRDSLQGQFDAQSKYLKQLETRYVEYFKTIQDVKNKEAEIVKFNSDQQRKLLVERSKDDIALALATNKQILDSDKKFHDEKEAAINKQYQFERNLANTNRINVTGTSKVYGDSTENPNVSATPVDISIALNKQTDDIRKADIKHKKELEDNDIEFYQRKIKALKDINKDEAESEAEKNERIYKNEQKSLTERLESYKRYIELKQQIKDFEFGVEIQKAAARPGGLTSLTPEEKQSLEVNRKTGQAEIAANGEKQVYDIVYTSLKQIIKDTTDLIKTEEDLSKEGYTKALESLNKSYDDKKISLTKYKEERKKIDNKYQKIELDEQIKQDEEALSLLEETYSSKIQLEVDYRRALLATAQEGGNQTEIDRAKGAVDAAEQAQTDIEKNIKVAKDKLSSDKLKRAKIGPYDDEKELAKWVDAAVRVEKKITDSVQKLHDQRIENQIAYVEKQKELMDEQYDHEATAIEDSTLKQKDKQALEIQIDAEKREMAANAANEEKRLKIEEFNFNKKLALADAAVGIAAAIIKDGLTTPKSIADAAIGAIEIATILATQPPSFAEGVDYLPFTMKARYGEAGPELVKKPGQPAFVAMSETISTLPKGTQIIPLRSDYPEFNNEKKDDSWEQTKFLAKQIKSSKKEITNIFKPTIVVDMNFESRKRQILGN